jgi:hypothetical protein
MSDSKDSPVNRALAAIKPKPPTDGDQHTTDALRDHPAGKYGNNGKYWTDVAKQSALRTHP